MISLFTMLSYRLQDKWIKKLVSKLRVQIYTFVFLKLKRRQDVQDDLKSPIEQTLKLDQTSVRLTLDWSLIFFRFCGCCITCKMFEVAMVQFHRSFGK